MGNVLSTFQALWTKMLFCPFSMHKDVSLCQITEAA